MQVQNNVNFGKKRIEFPQTVNEEQARKIINTPDNTLARLAYEESQEKYAKKYKRNRILSTASLVALPAAWGVKNALTNPNLTTKMAKTLGGIGTTSTIGAGFVGGNIATALYNKISNHIPFLKKAKEDSQGAYFLSQAGVFIGGAFASAKGVSKLLNKNWDNIENGLRTLKDKSIPKKVIESVTNFATKYPASKKIAKTIARFAPAALILTPMVLSLRNSFKQDKEVKQTFNDVKNFQGQIATEYVKKDSLRDDYLSNQILQNIADSLPVMSSEDTEIADV